MTVASASSSQSENHALSDANSGESASWNTYVRNNPMSVPKLTAVIVSSRLRRTEISAASTPAATTSTPRNAAHVSQP